MDKKGKISLTNEEFRNKFKNNFDLVNYAIKLAENMVKSGRDPRVKSEVQNRAMLILEEIREGKDQFDEIKSGGSSEEMDFDRMGSQKMVYEERLEKRRYSMAEAYHGEE